MSKNDMKRMNPAELLKLVQGQARLLDIRQIQMDALGKDMLEKEEENARLGSMLIIALRKLGGRIDVAQEEMAMISPNTAVNVQGPTETRPVWSAFVVEPLPSTEPEQQQEQGEEPLEVRMTPCVRDPDCHQPDGHPGPCGPALDAPGPAPQA